MPSANPPGMQRVMVQGVPMWRNSAKELFAYDHITTTNPIRLGTESGGLVAGWQDIFEPRLKQYRESLDVRARVPTAANKK